MPEKGEDEDEDMQAPAAVVKRAVMKVVHDDFATGDVTEVTAIYQELAEKLRESTEAVHRTGELSDRAARMIRSATPPKGNPVQRPEKPKP